MKLSFFAILTVCALAGNLKAQSETIWQQIGRAMDTQAQVAARRELREEYKEAIEAAQLQAQAEAERQAAIQAALTRGLKYQELRSKLWHVEHPIVDGDSLPLSNEYDDEATVRVYLHDSGYTDLSDTGIAKVRAYMHAHGIKHVSELGQ